MRDSLYVATTRVAKRCVCCNKIVPAGTRAVLRTFTKETSWGFMPGGYIGARVRQNTHVAHIACAVGFPLALGRATAAEIPT